MSVTSRPAVPSPPRRYPPRSLCELRLLKLASQALADFQRLDPQGQTSSCLEQGWTLFRELRDVLRLSDQELPGGPRSAPAAALLPEVAAARLHVSAAGSPHGWPLTGRQLSSPSPSCSAIWTATARAWSAIPSPAMRPAGGGRGPH